MVEKIEKIKILEWTRLYRYRREKSYSDLWKEAKRLVREEELFLEYKKIKHRVWVRRKGTTSPILRYKMLTYTRVYQYKRTGKWVGTDLSSRILDLELEWVYNSSIIKEFRAIYDDCCALADI